VMRPAEIPVAAAVVAKAVQSTVNVEADGCGGRHEGSGFAVGEDLVATNAHVVAGAERIRSRRPDGRLLRTTIVLFDPARDLALLSVPGLGQSPLPIGEADEGTAGAVLGYPGGQDTVRVAPAIVRQEAPTTGRDIYNRNRTQRQVLYLASSLRPGDSGGALIDTDGRVVGVAFAIAPDRPGTAYALDDSELRAALAAPRTPDAGGPCI
jgi:S1-C subfamily serine protease